VRFDHSRQVQVIERNKHSLVLKAVGQHNTCAESCSSRGVCGGSAGALPVINLPLHSPLGVSDSLDSFKPPVGTELDVQVSGALLLVSSSLVYLGPVVLMLLFSVVSGLFFPQSEVLAIVFAGFGFGVGLLAIHVIGSDKWRAGRAYKRFVEKHLAVEPGTRARG